MKVKITKKTGDVVELEGTDEEIKKLIKESLTPDQESLPNYNWYFDWKWPTSPVYCLHEYPNPWWGTTMPACRKCGYIPLATYPQWTCSITNVAGNASDLYYSSNSANSTKLSENNG